MDKDTNTAFAAAASDLEARALSARARAGLLPLGSRAWRLALADAAALSLLARDARREAVVAASRAAG